MQQKKKRVWVLKNSTRLNDTEMHISVLQTTAELKPSHTSERKIWCNVPPCCTVGLLSSHTIQLSTHLRDKRHLMLLDSLLLLCPLLYRRCRLAVTLSLSTSNPQKGHEVRSPWQLRPYLQLGWDCETWHLKLEEEMEWECTRQQEAENLKAMKTEFEGKRLGVLTAVGF